MARTVFIALIRGINVGGQFYSAQMVRSLSEAGETSSSGPGGGSGGAGGAAGSGGFSPAGLAIPPPSGSSGGLSPQSFGNDTQQASQVGIDTYLVAGGILGPESAPAWVLATIAASVDFVVNFFEDIFGGGSTPEIPRQLRHNRHPLYPVTLGVPDSIIVDEMSAGPEETCGDLQICTIAPLAQNNVLEIPQPTPRQPTPRQAAPTPTFVPFDEVCRQVKELRRENQSRDTIITILRYRGVPEDEIDLAIVNQMGNPNPCTIQ